MWERLEIRRAEREERRLEREEREEEAGGPVEGGALGEIARAIGPAIPYLAAALNPEVGRLMQQHAALAQSQAQTALPAGVADAGPASVPPPADMPPASADPPTRIVEPPTIPANAFSPGQVLDHLEADEPDDFAHWFLAQPYGRDFANQLAALSDEALLGQLAWAAGMPAIVVGIMHPVFVWLHQHQDQAREIAAALRDALHPAAPPSAVGL
jgi:hypothetical protein